MADRHSPTAAKFLGLAADIFDLHALRGFGEIEMHIDFRIELARDRKNAIDLLARVGVEIGHRPDRARTAAQPLDQKLFRTGIVGHSLLRKDADFDVDAPGIIAGELFDRLQPDQADAGIELHMGTHPHRAVRYAALQRLLSPCIDILRRESALGRGGFANGFRNGALLDTAAVHDAGLVEMNMSFDKAGDQQTSLCLQFGPVGRKRGRDGGDLSAIDGDIDLDEFAVLQYARIADNEIHHFPAFGTEPRYASSSNAPRSSAGLPSAMTRPPPRT